MIRKGEEPIPGYRLEKFLGKGHFGEVWRASAPGGTVAALKFINLGDTQGFKELAGIRRVKEIRHPHLMPITALWTLDAEGNILSDRFLESLQAKTSRLPRSEKATLEVEGWFVESQPKWLVVSMLLGTMSLLHRLEDCLESGLPGIPVHELLGYMDEAAKGIDYLNSPQHDLGEGPISIQHCDIKPANIMLLGNSAVVCDFGLARVLSSSTATATSMIGTPAYMPPECVASRPGPGSDQYALAISYVELRTGKLPFAALNYMEVLESKQKGKLDLSRLSPGEMKVVRRATAVDPVHRFDSNRAFVAELRRAVELDSRDKSSRRMLFGWRRSTTSEETPARETQVEVDEHALATQREEISRYEHQLHQESEELKEARRRLEEERKEQKIAAELIAKQRSQLEKQERHLQAAEEAISVQRQEVTKRRAELQQEWDLLTASRRRLEMRKSEQEVATEQVQQQRSQIEQHERELQERVQQLTEERDDLTRRWDELAQERAALSDSRGRFSQQTAEQVAAAEKLHHQSERLEQLEQDLAERERVLAAERDEIARCQEELKRERQALIESRGRFEAERNELREAEKKRQQRAEEEALEQAKEKARRDKAVAPSARRDPIPQRFPVRNRADDYDVAELIGRGANGFVYRAQRKTDRLDVAVKVVETPLAIMEIHREEFLRALASLQRLQHPNLVSVLDVGASPQESFVVQEYCGSGNLGDLVRRLGGKVPLQTLTPLIIYSLFGLQYLHDAQIVHGNIKLENVLLSGGEHQWVPKLSDFGPARSFERAGSSSFGLSGDISATSAFLPRSQVDGDPSANFSNDLWSLSACFYYALCGYFPVDVADGRDSLAVLLQDNPVPIRVRDPSIPLEIAAVVDRGLSPELAERFQTATEMRSALWQAVLSRGRT